MLFDLPNSCPLVLAGLSALQNRLQYSSWLSSSLDEKNGASPCPFVSQEARADTNIDNLDPDPDAASSGIRASERFDTISCVFAIACGTN